MRSPADNGTLESGKIAAETPLAAAREAKAEAEAETESEASRTAPRNFLLLALYEVAMRIGWIFKTETIVMPAVLDFLGGGPVLRGMLPVLNRFGFAVPPVFIARRLKITPRKKFAVAMATLAMAVPFAILSGLWVTGLWQTSAATARPSMPWVFLVLYGLFFAMTGMNQVASHTLQGKLVAANRRGRLFMVAICLGVPLAILAASMSMPGWLAMPDGGFGYLFAAPAVAFAVAACIVLALQESADDFQQQSAHPVFYFGEAAGVIRHDPNFRRLAVVAALYGATFMMFPHYQAMGRELLGLDRSNLMWWVCVQNAATALASLLAGPLADRYGNRLALRVMVFGGTAAPLLAVSLAVANPESTRPFFWLIFLGLGMTPITIKLLANYTLEVAPRQHHPRYLSTLGLALALPVMVGAPLVGWAVGKAGYELVFCGGATAVLAAGLQTFRLSEPRHPAANATPPALEAGNPI